MTFRKRGPSSKYLKRNGFDEYTKHLPTESLKEAEATKAQDVARFVIREMGSFFPSLAEMQREVETPETAATLTDRIKRLKKENHDNMTKLSRYYAQGLYDDASDRYRQTDDIKYHDLEDFTTMTTIGAVDASASSSSDQFWAQHYTTLENFYRQTDKFVVSEHNDLVARMQYDHLRELIPLCSRRRDLERKEDIAGLVRAATSKTVAGQSQHQPLQFPQSTKDYRMLSSRKEARLLVARFLMAKEPIQENIRVLCRWTRQETEPLMRGYKNNATFRTEIEAFIANIETKDPRSRRAGELG